MTDVLRVILRPTFTRRGARLHGKSVVTLDGRQVCISRQPLLDAARILIKEGIDPATPIATRHASFDALTSTVGAAARWTVWENETQSPTFVRWKAFSRDDVQAPMRSGERPAPDPVLDAETHQWREGVMLIRHPDSERGHDLYETPEAATLALLAVEPLPPTILEPACGRGAISKVLRGAGHTVLENDIVDYGQGQRSVQDFLTFTPAQVDKIDAVVTNPPYRLAQQFVRHALTLCPRVFMLLRLTFLESERRRDVLEDSGLIRVHVFRNRLPMMHRDGWAGNRASNSVAFAWFVWERGYRGNPEIDRISWDRGAS